MPTTLSCDTQTTTEAFRASAPILILGQRPIVAARSAGIRKNSTAVCRFELGHKLSKIRGLFGERGGNRTHDPLIKSQMLYLLSYALA
jgi:hypothetical protein